VARRIADRGLEDSDLLFNRQSEIRRSAIEWFTRFRARDILPFSPRKIGCGLSARVRVT